jgi:hypothetical protein
MVRFGHGLHFILVAVGVLGSLHLIAYASRGWDLPSVLAGTRDMVDSDLDYTELINAVMESFGKSPEILKVNWVSS